MAGRRRYKCTDIIYILDDIFDTKHLIQLWPGRNLPLQGVQSDVRGDGQLPHAGEETRDTWHVYRTIIYPRFTLPSLSPHSSLEGCQTPRSMSPALSQVLQLTLNKKNHWSQYSLSGCCRCVPAAQREADLGKLRPVRGQDDGRGQPPQRVLRGDNWHTNYGVVSSRAENKPSQYFIQCPEKTLSPRV